MKRLLEFICVLVMIAVALYCWNEWDSGANRGLSFGYYGEFNNLSNALAKVPGVSIISSGYNKDATLEEIHFEMNRGGRKFNLEFGGRDPIRKLSGDELDRALSGLIEKASVREATN